MVERIRQLLEARQLTPTQFADAIGVGRPIVSHILSGRNKASLEVVQRILAAMPDLSMAWLLNGAEPMLTAATPVQTAPNLGPLPGIQPNKQAREPAKAVTPHAPAVNKTAESTPLLAVNGASPPGELRKRTPAAPTPNIKRFAPAVAEARSRSQAAAPTVDYPVEASTDTAAASSTPPVEMPASTSTVAQLMAGAEKPIRRIVIFYRDGTFADYQPE